MARAHINEVVQAHVERAIGTSGDQNAWASTRRNATAKALLDALFGLGRLQPLVEEEGVENIDIRGHDTVFVKYSDGRIVQRPPIWNSDKEMIAELQFIAAREGEGGRPYNATNPDLDMDLPAVGGVYSRLAALHPPITPWPKAVIRVHRLVDVTLQDLVTEHQTMTPQQAAFLGAAVRAGASIVVSGAPGDGKTTLVRALCSALDPLEHIATIEKERELYLDRMGDRHLIVTPMQHRKGQGERAADGTQPGEYTLVMCIEKALRLDAKRIIVGEVRGNEIDAMFQAMQAGVGSISTLHAYNTVDAIERMVTLTVSRGLTTEYAYRQISRNMKLLVQIQKITDENGRPRRIITQIGEVQPGEGDRPTVTDVFGLDPHTQLQVLLNRPSEALIKRLENHGLDRDMFLPGSEDRDR